MAQKGGKNRRGGKNENDDDKRELVFREDGQEYAQVTKMLGNGRLRSVHANFLTLGLDKQGCQKGPARIGWIENQDAYEEGSKLNQFTNMKARSTAKKKKRKRKSDYTRM